MPDAGTLNNPQGVATDSAGNLYVADYGNHRVLEYVTPLITLTTVANRVLGQPDYASGGCNNGGLSATSLCYPVGVAADSADNLYVADAGNNRVLEYKKSLTSDAAANEVFGQSGNFTTSNPNHGGLSASSLSNPYCVALDNAGDLYVADYGNSRVLEYSTPLTNTTADLVFGQGGLFTSSGCNSDTSGGYPTNSDLCSPQGVATDGAGNLYVADGANNNRVLKYAVAAVSLSPTSLSFTPELVAMASAAQKVALVNLQNAALSITSVSITGANSGDFSAKSSCGTSLKAHASCSISVTFKPTATGARTGTLTVIDGAGTQTAGLTGTGSNVKVSVASVSFGNQVYNTTSAVKTVTLTNKQTTGTLNVAGIVSSISINNGDFTYTGTTCGTTLAVNKTCTISLTFKPSILGPDTGALTFSAGPPVPVPAIGLSGTGIAGVTVSPASLPFGQELVGKRSAAKTVTLTNNQSVGITGISFSFSGADDFAVAASKTTCGATLAAKSSCKIGVTFTPAAAGARDATLNISDSYGSQSVMLDGEGT